MNRKAAAKFAAAKGFTLAESAYLNLNTLLSEVLGSTCVEGSGHTGGSVLDAQLSALAVLGGDGVDVVEDSLGQVVNGFLVSAGGNDQGSLDGNGGYVLGLACRCRRE